MNFIDDMKMICIHCGKRKGLHSGFSLNCPAQDVDEDTPVIERSWLPTKFDEKHNNVDEIAFLEYVFNELRCVNHQHQGNLLQKVNERIVKLRALTK